MSNQTQNKKKQRPRKGWAQPNLHRAQRAVLRFVADSTSDGVRDEARDESNRSNGDEALSRIRLRKEARKALRLGKQQQSKVQIKSKKKSLDKRRTKRKNSLYSQSNKGKGYVKLEQKGKFKRQHNDSMFSRQLKDESSKRAKLTPKQAATLERLKAAGLIDGGDEEIDEDDVTIRVMEKKLGIKQGRGAAVFAADDPLRDLLSFADSVVKDDGDDDGEVNISAQNRDAFDESVSKEMHENDDFHDSDGLDTDDVEKSSNTSDSNTEPADDSSYSEEILNLESTPQTDIYGRVLGPDGKPLQLQPCSVGFANDTTLTLSKEQPEHKYIPPALRRMLTEQTNRDGDNTQLNRVLRGLLNRLNDSNLSGIVERVASEFRSNSRNRACTVITQFILDVCIAEDRTLVHLLRVYAACVCALHSIIGTEVTAMFLQSMVDKFYELYTRQQSNLGKITDGESATLEEIEATIDKRAINIVSLIALVYHFRGVDCSFIFDLLNMFVEKMSALDIELILETLRTCGATLRHEEPEHLRYIFTTIKTRAQNNVDIISSARVKFMLESIQDLQGKKWKIFKDNREQLQPLVKALKSTFRALKVQSADPIKVPLADLLDAKTKGRWWLVGAAWYGRDLNVDKPSVLGREVSGYGLSKQMGSDEEQNLDYLARAQRMNTEIRRKVFHVIMTAEDYVDALEKLLRLKLRGTQEREIIRVAIDCCIQEKKFNPYYAVLLHSLCNNSPSLKHTFKFAAWDRLREIENSDSLGTSNFVQLLAFMISKGSINLTVLKVISFAELSPDSIKVFQEFFRILLTRYSENAIEDAFSRLVKSPGGDIVKDSIFLFFRHYLNEDDLRGLLEDRQAKLLTSRIAMAERACTAVF